MANTTFFYRAKNNPDSITWKDIFSDFRKKHSKKDLEYAMLSGTSLMNVNEGNMLEKWQKPWIFYPCLKGGVALILFIYGLYFLTAIMSGGRIAVALEQMLVIVPPLVMPIILMIFFWELNIPKNLSIYELLAFFVIGGFLSMAVTSLTFQYIPDGPAGFEASYAAFREEPGKLVPALLFLMWFGKRKKVYGLTGLVIGAAVGAGFGAFESISYAFKNEDTIGLVIFTQVLRNFTALGSHVIYCAPYTAAFAMAMRKYGGFHIKCFVDKDFLLMFAASTGMHFLWNSSYNTGIVTMVLFIVIKWFVLLYIIKKCLKEIVIVGKNQRSMASFPGGAEIGVTTSAQTFNLRGVGGYMDGRTYPINVSEITFGRDASCRVRYPSDAPGISKVHCKLFWKNGTLMLMDMNSSYGTYTTKGKIPPMVPVPIQFGEVFYIAKKENQFTIQ